MWFDFFYFIFSLKIWKMGPIRAFNGPYLSIFTFVVHNNGRYLPATLFDSPALQFIHLLVKNCPRTDILRTLFSWYMIFIFFWIFLFFWRVVVDLDQSHNFGDHIKILSKLNSWYYPTISWTNLSISLLIILMQRWLYCTSYSPYFGLFSLKYKRN